MVSISDWLLPWSASRETTSERFTTLIATPAASAASTRSCPCSRRITASSADESSTDSLTPLVPACSLDQLVEDVPVLREILCDPRNHEQQGMSASLNEQFIRHRRLIRLGPRPGLLGGSVGLRNLVPGIIPLAAEVLLSRSNCLVETYFMIESFQCLFHNSQRDCSAAQVQHFSTLLRRTNAF